MRQPACKPEPGPTKNPMNRIDKTFAGLSAAGRKALVIYLTAGDPDAETSYRALVAAADAGADVLELGLPFSDPTADGPVIQRASQRAIAGGMTVIKALALVRRFRASGRETPIVLFSYGNPLFAYGYGALARDAADAGADGVLCVDIPPEEAGELEAATSAAGLHVIRLAAPTTTDSRLAKITMGAGGFLYVITRLGVTGTGGLDFSDVAALAARIRKSTALPLCLGFGVSSGEDAARLAPHGDGVVCGSAVVKLSEEKSAEELPAAVAAKVAELRAGVDSAPAK